jgi:hypothetical protein
MAASSFIDRIAQAHGCSRELAAALMTDGLAALHEASFKRGAADGMRAVHADLGPLAAWHFVGLLVDAAESGHASILVQDYLRIDPEASRFDKIADRWSAEVQAGKD